MADITNKQPRDFGFTDEARQLKQTARQFFQKKLPTIELHKLVASESDPYRTPQARWNKALWQDMVELGWSAIAVPESAGGLAMPLVAVAALIEESGRAAVPSPLLSTLQACYLLRACLDANDDKHSAAHNLLQEIARGKAVSLALCNAQGAFDGTASDVQAREQGGDIVLNGTSYFVQDAAKADYFVVRCRAPLGERSRTTAPGREAFDLVYPERSRGAQATHAPTDDCLYIVPAQSPGVTIIPDHIVDLTRDQAHVSFSNVRTRHAVSLQSINRAMPAILSLLAADMAGAAEWQLQTTVEYARTREQFDHPIGFFQAVKHPLVDLMLLVDQTRGLVYNAACAVDVQANDAEVCARMAKASACDMAAFASRKSVQLHGGIGFTWECFVHLYQKRQKHSQVLFGDALYQRRKMADLVFDTQGVNHD